MRRWFAGRARIEYAPDGHPRRMTGLNVDVDERRRLEDALLVADQRKDEFLATLAHELRNPLAPIRNAVSVLRGARDDPAVLEQVGDVVERQVALMGRLLDDLLDTSRITRNVLTLRKERVLLSRIVDTALESSRPFIDAQMQQLTVRLPPEPIALDADPDRLAQVLTNLLNNAAKYTEQGGQILLTAECADGRLRLCVRDTGIGIPADKLDRVFDLFAQVAPQSDSARHGLGIGLALSKRLVEMHQGTISVTSAGVGAGSEFVISLPLPAAGVVAIPRTAQMPPRPPAARKILVVDDNVDAAKTLQLVLALDGHAVTIAHDGLEGIEAAEAQRPDVILMDLGMPRLDGCEAARRLRSRAWSNGTVLVALTGWGQESDRARVTAAGFDHHLVKPVDPDALAALLRDVHAGGGVGAPEAAAFDAIRLVEGVSPTGNVGP
jgi:two-component system CheB/CheR fusion protein